MTAGHHETEALRPRSNRLFLQIEHALYMTLGFLLCVTAVLALAGASATLWHGLGEWSATDTVFQVIDRLLFVLMLIEIMHTVRVSVESGSLESEPFLVVGLIASIRRILVITLESSKIAQQSGLPDETDRLFRTSMIELGVLAMLILVMMASIYMLHAAPGGSEEERIGPGHDLT